MKHFRKYISSLMRQTEKSVAVVLLFLLVVSGLFSPAIFPAQQAQAAVTAAHLTDGGQETGGTSYQTPSITPSANKLVLASIWTDDSVNSCMPTLAGNGLTWVRINSQIVDHGEITLFRAMGASPSSGVVTISCGSGNNTSWGWSIDEFSNIDTSGTNGSGAIVQNNTNGARGVSSLTVTLGSAFSSSQNATYGAFGSEDTYTFNAGSGFTMLGQEVYGTDSVVMSEWRNDNDTTVNVSCTSCAADIVGVAVEIKAAGNTTPSITGAGCSGQNHSDDAPVTEGSAVDFCVDWNDPDAGDSTVDIIICKTNSVTVANPPTCPGGAWTSAENTMDNPESNSLSYTTTGSDVGTQNYHLYVCDDEPSCSSVVSDTFTVDSTPAATTNAASNVTDTAARLNGTVSGVGSTDYYFRYRTTTSASCTDNDSWGTKTTTQNSSNPSGTAFYQDLGSFTASTQYWYCAFADDTISTDDGGVITFTTDAATAATCSTAGWICTKVADTAAIGDRGADLVFDLLGAAAIFYEGETGDDHLSVAHYVGSLGNCDDSGGSDAWQCDTVDSPGSMTNVGAHPSSSRNDSAFSVRLFGGSDSTTGTKVIGVNRQGGILIR